MPNKRPRPSNKYRRGREGTGPQIIEELPSSSVRLVCISMENSSSPGQPTKLQDEVAYCDELRTESGKIPLEPFGAGLLIVHPFPLVIVRYSGHIRKSGVVTRPSLFV